MPVKLMGIEGGGVLGVMRRLINKEMGNIKILEKKNWEGDVNEVLIVLATLKKKKLNI